MINNFIKNNKDYLIVTLISILVFCSIYGIKVLNPTYTDWLMAGGDLSQHYLGWVAYRKSAWHFPIGLVDTLAYPGLTSIMFTDSIPLLAIPFKILSPILPSEFQFFGLWGICSFILQGLLSVKIIKNFTNNSLILILVSLLFLYTPVMIGRMYGHTSLAGHWILLLMLDLLFSYKENSSNNIYIYIYQ